MNHTNVKHCLLQQEEIVSVVSTRPICCGNLPETDIEGHACVNWRDRTGIETAEKNNGIGRVKLTLPFPPMELDLCSIC